MVITVMKVIKINSQLLIPFKLDNENRKSRRAEQYSVE